MKELKVALQAAKSAGEIIMKYYRSNYEVKDKSPNNPVTTADLEANKEIQEIIMDNFPDDGWLSEETKDSSERLTKPRVWIIDPIDGTKEFIEGLSQFAVSIALVENGKPIVGVLHNPATSEVFNAVSDGGAFCDGRPIKCIGCDDLKRASALVSRTEKKKGMLEDFVPILGDLHYIGSVAYKLGKLATGASNLYFTVQPKNEWDICAGDLIVREAGGIVLDGNFQTIKYNERNPKKPAGIFAGKPEILDELIEHYNKLQS
ncbi:MAG: 3'(2'),5'-bisphosphate nucleotidase CysQ [Candidatus Poribacteria bacterium]|mgnify:FL=1|jgi:myo-inositol-1(or 4)-monophosphatase|nr:3'(2'),5'-bisphosphate nucleotidase CysQ [Candidatus Poribacteria bacterium]